MTDGSLFQRYHRELLDFLRRRLTDRHAAEDLAQETFVRVYAAQRAGNAIVDARALLYRTARNLVIDGHRHGAVRHRVESDDAHDDAFDGDSVAGPAHFEPDVALASRQGVEAIIAVIESLPPRCRSALVLHRFEGMSQAAVAARMGITVKTVESHLRAALIACERAMRSEDGGVAPVTWGGGGR